MFLKQYYLSCLAHASYLIADEETKTAIVVDPQRDIDQYLDDAERQGFRIEHVFLTHFHADFVAGHIELRKRTGAVIHLGARADAEYDFVPAKNGDKLEWGKLRLEILETPGHTPEGVSIVVYDLSKSDAPHAVLTGDTLFIGDVGRPDLMASIGITAEELAGLLYDSLHEKLMKLPDETLVYPAHGAGSMCGKNLSTDTVSTIGAQRAHNYALQPMPKDEFITMTTSELPQAPDYFSFDAMANRKERGTLEESMSRLAALTLDETLRLAKDESAQLLDTRSAQDFAGAHFKGSINIGLDGQFATWSGTLLAQNRPIIIIAEPGSEQETAKRLGRIGFDHVAGYLQGGMLALKSRSDLIEKIERITSTTLSEQMKSESPPVLLDVRTPTEWEEHHASGSINIPLNQLKDRLAEIPRATTLVTMCRTGYRSSVAASILRFSGFTDILDQVGGIVAWDNSGPQCEVNAGAPDCSAS